MKLFLTYAFLLTVTFTSYAQHPLKVEEKESIIQEVKMMLENYHDDIVKDGIEDELKYLDSSSDFFWVPPGYNSALDYSTIKGILLANSKTINYIEFSWETIKIFPLTNKIATYTGIVKCVEVDTSNKAMNFQILESGTVIKRENGWKFLNGQSRILNKD